MQRIIQSLLITIALVSCGTDHDSRYQDLSHLERPPTLPTGSTTASASGAYVADDSRIEKKSTTTGLGDKVSLNTSSPLVLRIRMPVAKAWYALAQAIKQSSYKVTDYDRAKNVYYLSSGETSDGFFSFLSSSKKINYVINMKEANGETLAVASLADKDTPENEGNAEADQLLKSLYAILHDDLQLDYNGA